jgi:N5-(cytidine 5'-diphosphoramidyl)-L-glutamine hydrolase
VTDKRRIGVTQRVEVAPGSERRDCLDQRWAPIFDSLGLVLVPLANRVADPATYLRALDLAGLVFSGGNDLDAAPGARAPAPERDRFEQAALTWALGSDRPVLGVCRGLQAINVFLGGRIEPVAGHAGTRHAVRALHPAPPYEWPASFEVNSYHDFSIPAAGLAPDLVALAASEDGGIEAFRHRSRRCVGIMWHPEREAALAGRDSELMRGLFLGA